ncbi:MAG: hypothetical protein K5790_00555 [Nitrosopumilus sp.]|uniref:hypothetical protein n=1 Tax=Nitrosopumilus sp. TaxID=2024843 RepID=UPI00247D3108|nr:hypothetical protein [Nitrosopumilus sp.]MCV0391767.1 hypothetical protein [Nitrosopumilus sp.]
MKKRGPIIAIVGVIMVMASLSIAMSIVPSTMIDSNSLQASSLFEGMFDEVSNEIQIMPGKSEYVSYSTLSNVPLLWGIQINDYQPDDLLSIKISNIFGDEYGTFTQDSPILFDMLEIKQSDTLNLEIQNLGPRNVHIVTMFSEDPENSDAFSNPNSPIATMILPLAISGFFLILGAIVTIVGIIVILVDWKNNQNNKRNY